MEGNYSLLSLLPYLNNCADVQAPLMINIILGLPANMCVMWLILARSGDKAAEIFALNQALCEVSICMANALLLIVMNTTGSGVFSTYVWCTIRFSLGFLFSGRPLFMSCVCLERYLAVIHPVTFLRYKLLRYRLAVTVISWLIILGCCTVLSWVQYPTLYYVSFAMAFPCFLVQLFCCAKTLHALVQPGPGEQSQERKCMNSAKQKAFKSILIIIVSEAFTYLPYVTSIILLGNLSGQGVSKLFCASNYTALITGFTPPLLYIYRTGKLQRCMRHGMNPST